MFRSICWTTSTLLTLSLGIFFFQVEGRAADEGKAPASPPAAERKTIQSRELERVIGEVIRRPEYRWRFPREKNENESKGFLATFAQEVFRTVFNALKPMKKWVKKFFDWIDELFRRMMKNSKSGRRWDWDWQLMAQILGLALLAVAGSLLAIFLWRLYKRRSLQPVLAQALPAVPAPDLQSEEIEAGQLQPDEWQALAMEMLQKGELRLALRAFYLSMLACLARQELITLARHKTNREYATELRRRARERGELLDAFGHNVGLFESGWYGMHEVTGEIIQRFNANQETIKTGAEK